MRIVSLDHMQYYDVSFNLMRYYMPIEKPLPEEINGFKILEDLGQATNKIRYAIVICKACKQEFKTSIYHIKKIQSCGCLSINLAKPLPDIINGFKIVKDFGYNNGSRRALVICKVCQKEYEVDPNKLRYRKHCGCLRKGQIACRYVKEYPRLANIYKHMKGRCYRKSSQDYYLYGERGIEICEEWLSDRNKFCEWSLENGYRNDLSIDRIDSNGNYCPENCRWTDSETQSRNTSRNVLDLEKVKLIRKERKTMTYKELADKYNVSKATICAVLANRIWKK